MTVTSLMYKFITFIRSVSRKNTITAIIVISCGLVGTAWGWFASITTFNKAMHATAQKIPKQDTVFVLPPRPPVAPDQPKEVMADLRIWELTARQPLPPRTEPLTAPGWKIVGVTSIGNDANVLLLFDKQIDIEARKVGDSLPGGAKIIQISQDVVRIVLNGQYMKLSLRKQ